HTIYTLFPYTTLFRSKEISRSMIKYCEQALGATHPENFKNKERSSHVLGHQEQVLEEARKEQEQQVYIVEMLYHRLFVDLDDGRSEEHTSELQSPYDL